MDLGSKRFSFLNDEEINVKVTENTPINTVRNTTWTVNLWNTWARERNKIQKNTDSPTIPEAVDITKTITELEFMNFLKRFVFEVRNKHGKPYTADSLKLLCCGIQRYLRDNGWPLLAFMDRNQRQHKHFHNALDSKCKELHLDGVRAPAKKEKQWITEDQETMLWDKGIFNTYSSKGLSYCVFFYTSKVFGIRTGGDHRCLQQNQFSFGFDEFGKYVQFHGDSRKTLKEGSRPTPQHFTSVKHYQNINNPRCYYNILEKYMSLIPKDLDDIFYFRPGYESMYLPSALGKHTLDSYFAQIMKEAQIDGYFTNHSIKAYTATDKSHKNRDAQCSMEQAGHISITGACGQCKRSISEQELTPVSINEQELTSVSINEQELTSVSINEQELMPVPSNKYQKFDNSDNIDEKVIIIDENPKTDPDECKKTEFWRI